MIDTSRLTAEETEELLRQCIAEVTEETLFRVLNAELSSNQKTELSLAWEDEPQV